jgi:hypothetical protein
MAATARFLRPAFGMYRVEWPGNSGVAFHLSHGDWIRLLRRSSFEVEDLIEGAARCGSNLPSPLRHCRVGPELAVRRGVEGAQNELKVGSCQLL